MRWPRVFAFANVPDSRDLQVRAAALAAGPQAALSHVTAAEVLELRHLPTGLAESRIDIAVPRGHSPTVRGVIVHHPILLPYDHIIEEEDLRYTNVPRTLLDLANVVWERSYRRILDAALSEERTSCDELNAMIAFLGSFPGVRLARRTVEAFDPRMVGSRSDLERTFFRGLQAAGVDLPTANVEIRDADGRQRFLDFAYIPERQPIEIDSDRYHASTLARAEDGARQNAIALTGEWRAPLRFDEHDVRERMPRVAEEVRRTLTRIRASM
ncbi:MAG: hypothetical protein KY469_13720 [Actinobacteria bacterium]|nr:hypothetical protein [Actinomycetota bacterium]